MEEREVIKAFLDWLYDDEGWMIVDSLYRQPNVTPYGKKWRPLREELPNMFIKQREYEARMKDEV